MEKNVFKKSLAIGIIILFLGAGVVPGVLGNNYSSIECISEEYNQSSSSNNDEYLMIWGGDGTVFWNENGAGSAKVTCYPNDNFTKNLSEPSTIYLITMINTILDLGKNYVVRRGGYFQITIIINDVRAGWDYCVMNAVDEGRRNNCMGVITPIHIENNITLNIQIKIQACPVIWGIQMKKPISCTREVIVRVQLT